MAVKLHKFGKANTDRPVIMTIFGEGGMGKTSLAALMPNPVFICTEDGLKSLSEYPDVQAFDRAESFDDVMGQIETLLTTDHDRKTLVIDSITQLATMVEAEIVAKDRAKSINQAIGGYGAGYKAAAEKHRQVRQRCGDLATERNMHIVFIGHATTETVNMPDLDPYGRYTINIHKDSVPHYTDNVDLVGYLRLKTFTTGDGEKKKAISTQEREIICFPAAANRSKNRFGITQPIDFLPPHETEGANPFAQYIPNL